MAGRRRAKCNAGAALTGDTQGGRQFEVGELGRGGDETTVAFRHFNLAFIDRPIAIADDIPSVQGLTVKQVYPLSFARALRDRRPGEQDRHAGQCGHPVYSFHFHSPQDSFFWFGKDQPLRNNCNAYKCLEANRITGCAPCAPPHIGGLPQKAESLADTTCVPAPVPVPRACLRYPPAAPEPNPAG